MTPKQHVASLLKIIRDLEGRSRHKLATEQQQAVEDAIQWLRSESSETLSVNPGGVCDNCGNPRFAHHADGTCWTDEECERGGDRLDRWRQAVGPLREMYQLARAQAKDTRRQVKRGKAGPGDVERAERVADRQWAEYQLAIRKADREAGEINGGIPIVPLPGYTKTYNVRIATLQHRRGYPLRLTGETNQRRRRNLRASPCIRHGSQFRTTADRARPGAEGHREALTQSSSCSSWTIT